MAEIKTSTQSQETHESGLLFVEENQAYRLSLYLDQQQMTCRVAIELSLQNDHRSDTLLKPSDLIWFLTQNNIIQTIDYPALYRFCAAVELNEIPDNCVIAKGMEARPGIDGWFELTVKTSGKEHVFEEDADGNVDLKTLNAYSEIEPEQKLGIVHPPQKGVAGMTVLGTPIPAEPGQVYALIAGEGVELKYNNRIAFSTRSGRALLEKNVLSVVDQLYIPGDLGLDVGHIDFHGFVEIKGDVPDDFQVKASRGIKISGLVGACKLNSQGSIEISSMAGKGVGEIICRGELRAGFLNQVKVSSYGNIYVTNEIRNSLVKSTGRVNVEKGAIIGGECIAMEGIETRVAGTTSGQKTRLVAGVYFPDIDRFEFLRQQLLNVNRQIDSLKQGLIPLEKYVKRHPAAGETVCKRFHILRGKMEQLSFEKDRLSAEVAASMPQQFKRQNPKINVHSRLLEGVTVVIGDSTEEIHQPRSGPLSIIENSKEGGMRYLPLSPLKLNASVIEREFLIDDSAAQETTDD